VKEGEPGYVSNRIADSARFNEKMRNIMTKKSIYADSADSHGAPDTSPGVSSMKRSPLDRRVSASGRGGRGFSRSGSIIVSQGAQPDNDTTSNKDDLEPIIEAEPEAVDRSNRRGPGFDGHAMGAGRGRGLGMATLTPRAAMKRQSVNRISSNGEGRATTPVPNESF